MADLEPPVWVPTSADDERWLGPISGWGLGTVTVRIERPEDADLRPAGGLLYGKPDGTLWFRSADGREIPVVEVTGA